MTTHVSHAHQRRVDVARFLTLTGAAQQVKHLGSKSYLKRIVDVSLNQQFLYYIIVFMIRRRTFKKITCI